ncbi:Gfo/Idh/MocA family oxidoreductase [Catenuloplanes indicus]|uniref:Thiazolinyl imide reductase n=1 Tax=Catenuloplanes indicus TaxID=137267 RepID=A0AAE3VUF3_9ACTN|nr:Gfo/Idh/MocA family oxidoreductase [Catenuloplanes indicus]MDQ0363539.1 thiazolinyl imide reductase [Catenuloplanes indicus]
MSRPLRVVVCGTNFGRFYTRAVAAHPGCTLAGVLSTGSDYSRAHAAAAGVTSYTSAAELPSDVDAACVVVGGAVSGGHGTELALALLARGVHVLQEHPVHPDEIAACLRAARKAGVQYRVNTHYRHLAPVRQFLDAAARLRERRTLLFADVATSVHVLQPLADILIRALGGARPRRLSVPSDSAPLRSLHGELAGVPLTLRVQNQIDPGDRDNHALFWHRIALGTDGGVLTLADTHGPVLWSPRLHAPRDADRRLLTTGAGPSLDLPTTSVLGAATQPTYRDAFDDLWPRAIGVALSELAGAIEAGGDPLRGGQPDLAMAGWWRELMEVLGPPELISPPAPVPLAAAELGEVVPPAADDDPRGAAGTHLPPLASGPAPSPSQVSGYGPAAEFFDLAAREHAERSGPAVVAALAGIDTGHGPILEIGAGTGLITEAVAAAFPDAAVIAAEPEPAMRAILTSRIDAVPALRDRVSVVAAVAEDLELPDRLSAAVLCGVLGHLDASARHALLTGLAERLPPGAPIVVELMGLTEPVQMPPTRLVTRHLGDQRYEWWMSGEPAGPGRMRLDTTWRVHHGERVVREVRDGYHWFTLSVRQVADEAGLTCEPLPGLPYAAVLRAPLTR